MFPTSFIREHCAAALSNSLERTQTDNVSGSQMTVVILLKNLENGMKFTIYIRMLTFLMFYSRCLLMCLIFLFPGMLDLEPRCRRNVWPAADMLRSFTAFEIYRYIYISERGHQYAVSLEYAPTSHVWCQPTTLHKIVGALCSIWASLLGFM